MPITFISALGSESGGGGGGSAGVSITVACTSDFAGKTITCTDGTDTKTATCPSSSPYEVTFTGLSTGTWAISGTVSGETYSTNVAVTDYTAQLKTVTNLYNTNYDTAYGAANALVANNQAALCGSIAHLDGNGGLYNAYYSTSSDIANLSSGNMTSSYNGTVTVVPNKLTYSNDGDKSIVHCLVNGYVVVSRFTPVETGGLTMQNMKSKGNVFDFLAVNAGDTVNMPYETPDSEDTFVTFYEKL